ncbi:MAG: hypothetical protein DRN16_03530 [Thermoplasmata archaeon]|nr:MAG: hypothetical protein DRN16_03530 [Thermoplasmata archaeon]
MKGKIKEWIQKQRAHKVLLIILLLLVSVFFPVKMVLGDGIDQQQTNYFSDEALDVKTQGYYWGQSFVPQNNTITKISIPCMRMNDYGDIIVCLKQTVDGNVLVYKAVNVTELSNTALQWHDFDIPDYSVTPNTVYWIQVRAFWDGDDGYATSIAKIGYYNDTYANGLLHDYSNAENFSEFDMAFKVYSENISSTPPTVETLNKTIIYSDGAEIYGNLTSKGSNTTIKVGFDYGLTTSYGNNITVSDNAAIGEFSATLSGLQPFTTYHYRTYAIGDTIVYGEDRTFTTCSPNGYHEDQNSSTGTGGVIYISNHQSAAQSFIPTLPVLTKADMYLSRTTVTDDLTVSITKGRPDNNTVLRTKTILSSEIGTSNAWYSWDFNDLRVTPGDTYFIVLESLTDSSYGGYRWEGDANANSYANGSAWIKDLIENTDWETASNIYDAHFKTYGKSMMYVNISYSYDNLSISVNATNSSSSNSTIEHYQWDWENDGIYDAEGAVQSHTYLTNGTKNITLKIIDSNGDWESATINVTLENNVTGQGNITEGTEADNTPAENNSEDDGNQSNWFNWHLPLSITAIIVIVGLVTMGAAFVAYFMKPEIRSKVGIVASLATMFSILWIVIAIILYYADVPMAYLAADMMMLAVTLILTVRYYWGRRR